MSIEDKASLVSIESEMKRSYLDYAMSVIVSRALPDVRDGLKPVHRRILYTMYESGNHHDKPYKKSARIVGDVMGRYHPHGDAAIYASLVRMAQDFSLSNTLIDGQGNFGSMDGDSPAQMRYTEVRLSRVAAYILKDITLDTVDFQDNYDGSEQEPRVLPSSFPNLLVNGASGIAVGMATNIPTHNLNEVINASLAYIDDKDISSEELVKYVKGPDFPTGGIVLGADKMKKALLTGRGSVIVRAKVKIEEIGSRNAIIVTEIPYQVNKAELAKKIEYLSKEKIIEGLSEIRDESNKLGVRLVIELKQHTVPELVFNQLYKHTQLQISFAYNMLALDRGRPKLLSLRDIIAAFIGFREEVITRRTAFLLSKSRDKANVLIGLSIAVANIDKVIRIIKSALDVKHARDALMDENWDVSIILPLLKLIDDETNYVVNGKCKLNVVQAKAILEMRLQKLTALEQDKLSDELKKLAEEIEGYLEILGSEEKLFSIMKNELKEVKQKHSTPRRSAIEDIAHELDDEDLIKRETVVITITSLGYIKRVSLLEYRAQKRGGKGKSAMSTHEDDFTKDVVVTDTHTYLLFFSDKGNVYRVKAYKVPEGKPSTKGRAIVNLFPLDKGERITKVVPQPDNQELWEKAYLIFATARGKIRRSSLSAFASVAANGKIAISLENDSLVDVKIADVSDHILLTSKYGKAIRFPVESLRVVKSRKSDGVRGMRLSKKDDEVISLSILSGFKAKGDSITEYLKIPYKKRMKVSITSEEEKVESTLKPFNFEFLTVKEAVLLSREEEFIITITSTGFGKRTSSYEYRVTNRGGQGVINIFLKNSTSVSSFPIKEEEQMMLMTDGGMMIRTDPKGVRIAGRNTKGVKVIRLKKKEHVISISKISELDE